MEYAQKAREHCLAALEIRTKAKYPKQYALTARVYGSLLSIIKDAEAAYWLKEAYSLREFLLPNQITTVEKLLEGL